MMKQLHLFAAICVVMSVASTAHSQSWGFESETDPVTLEVSDHAYVQWHDGFLERVFMVRCTDGVPVVGISVSDYIGGVGESRYAVQYRFDSEDSATRDLWHVGATGTVLIAPLEAVWSLLPGLLSGSALHFRWTDYRGVSHTTEVPLRGSTSAIESLGCASDYLPGGDYDSDGIPNSSDACAVVAEDIDGFEDDDGCIDPNNDGDWLYDGADECPDEPEDQDEFEDQDGCPDPDNDGDGILDTADNCPLIANPAQADLDENGVGDDCDFPDTDGDSVPDADDRCPGSLEDVDGFQDSDGCADPDNDQDQYPDSSDRCPLEPEDRDGYSDGDGCPDPDNDGDGILDTADNCPNESNADQVDGDIDGIGDACDFHWSMPSRGQASPTPTTEPAFDCYATCIESLSGPAGPRLQQRCRELCD